MINLFPGKALDSNQPQELFSFLQDRNKETLSLSPESRPTDFYEKASSLTTQTQALELFSIAH